MVCAQVLVSCEKPYRGGRKGSVGNDMLVLAARISLKSSCQCATVTRIAAPAPTKSPRRDEEAVNRIWLSGGWG